jgi:LysR family transcriptional regulator, nod-box dependent transcriptional activator
MQFRQLDLNLLVALDALLTERNITEAGRRVFLTQSAMSGALSRLREHFADELLIQVGRKMVTTPLADSLAGPVREILLKIDAAVKTRPEFDPSTSHRRFSIMMSDYVSTLMMPEVLRRAEAQAPRVTFELLSNDVGNPLEILDRAEIDFLVMPDQFLEKEHPSQPLFDDSYVCLVWADNPLVGDSLTQQQYLELGHVFNQFRIRVPVIDEWFLTKLGLTRRGEVFANSFNSMPHLVVGTRRIATVHRRLAELYARYLPLRLLEPPFELPSLTEAMQWHKDFGDDPGRAWLRGIMSSVAADMVKNPATAATPKPIRRPKRA